MICKLIFEILAIVLIAFNQTLSLVPDSATGSELFWQTVLTSFVYLSMWFINRSYLMPMMMAKNRFLTYLLVLFIILFVAEWLTTMGTVPIFRVLTGTSLVYICFVGLSATRLMRAWTDISERETAIQQQILDKQLNSQRLKVDTKMMLSELERIQDKCVKMPDDAVDSIYRLSNTLRTQLYENK